MTTTEQQYDLEKKIIDSVYQMSKDYNGDDTINYPYASGVFEVMIKRLIDVMGKRELELVEKRLILKN